MVTKTVNCLIQRVRNGQGTFCPLFVLFFFHFVVFFNCLDCCVKAFCQVRLDVAIADVYRLSVYCTKLNYIFYYVEFEGRILSFIVFNSPIS